MGDFPGGSASLPVIGTHSREVGGIPLGSGITNAAPSSATWGAANLGLFVPLTLSVPYLLNRVWWANGAAVAGNVDCGIYSVGGTLLASAGSTAQSGTNVIQSVDVTDMLLTPGSYYLALTASSTSATFFQFVSAVSANIWKLAGWAQQSSALALPATFTLATISTSTNVPLFGICRASVI